jgi:hypothetical protein
MATGTGGLAHEVTVSSVGKTYDTDTFLNVIKRRENMRYRESVPLDSVNVAFVGSEALAASRNISIADRSTFLFANRIVERDYTTISSTNNFDISTDNFVVTDIYTDALVTQSPLPLFFKHVLDITNLPRVSATDLSLAAGVRLMSVEVLDVFLQPLRLSEAKIDYDEGVVYNNLKSEYISSGDFTPYYVKYVVRDGSNISTFVDLLDNENVYRLAEFDDLTPLLQIIPDGRKVYLIEETVTGFHVVLPIAGTYSYKTEAEAQIKLLFPAADEVDDTWYVRVTNGLFFTNLPDGKLYKYYIAEFLSQTFTPAFPYKRSIDETSIILSSTLIKLDRENIYEDPDEDIFLSVLINDVDGIGIAAYTTDPSESGTIADNGVAFVVWNNQDRLGIRSIDRKQGFVSIDGLKLDSSWEVVSNYHFRETNYEFTLVNFNPISNPDITDQKTVLFIDPDSSVVTKTQTLFYLQVNDFGKVIESNWSRFDNDTQLLDTGNPIYYEEKPSWHPDAVWHEFVDGFSVEGTQFGTFLILGDVTVAPAQSVEEVVEVDSRVRGGGIVAGQIDSAREIQPEIDWYWDIGNWDGIPYPGNASYLVEVPVEVLEGAGGTLRTDEVRDIVERHTAFGVYPVVRGYGIDVELTDVQFGAGSITLAWIGRGYETDIKYNIYYATSAKGPWTLANVTPVDHVGAGNTYTISGLKADTLYYIVIVGGRVDGDFQPLVLQPIGPLSEQAAGPESATAPVFAARTYEARILADESFYHQITVI